MTAGVCWLMADIAEESSFVKNLKSWVRTALPDECSKSMSAFFATHL